MNNEGEKGGEIHNLPLGAREEGGARKRLGAT